MPKNRLIEPIVKWAGGKRQLLPVLTPLLPEHFTTYCEPFLGGGALFFRKQPQRAIVNDINSEIIQVYEVIQNNVETLIAELEKHKNEPEYFYQVRSWDRDKEKYNTRSTAEKAARIIYLNRTCYNGLFRVNRAGEFNAPFGSYKKPKIVNAPMLRAMSEYFHEADITFSCRDYADVLAEIPEDSFVYLDPPYDPVSGTANFTGYSSSGFSREDQIRLRKCCDDLHRRGIKFMVSNSATDFIKEQYAEYTISIVQANRMVNSNGSGRGRVNEVVVRNYER